ncbi:hypothetical protein GCM10009112_23730 [Marinomonas arenicola]|uniref:hypothetical protein n=1 Tax=Marinomonas TaxID=28253 RepID=UPI0010561260|nr:hypothetical protein [Marinomonas sp. KMM3893]
MAEMNLGEVVCKVDLEIEGIAFYEKEGGVLVSAMDSSGNEAVKLISKLLGDISFIANSNGLLKLEKKQAGFKLKKDCFSILIFPKYFKILYFFDDKNRDLFSTVRKIVCDVMDTSFKYYGKCFDTINNAKTKLDNSVYDIAGENCVKQIASSVATIRELSKGKEITVEIDDYQPIIINTETVPHKLISKIDDKPHNLEQYEIIAVDKKKSETMVLPYTGKGSKKITLSHDQFCLFRKEYGFGLLPEGPFFDFKVKQITGGKYNLLSFNVFESPQNQLGL